MTPQNRIEQTSQQEQLRHNRRGTSNVTLLVDFHYYCRCCCCCSKRARYYSYCYGEYEHGSFGCSSDFCLLTPLRRSCASLRCCCCHLAQGNKSSSNTIESAVAEWLDKGRNAVGWPEPAGRIRPCCYHPIAFASVEERLVFSSNRRSVVGKDHRRQRQQNR